MHADRTTRALLTVLGMALLAAGTAGILAGTDVLGHHLADRHLTDNPIARYLGDNNVWFWPVAALVGLAAAILALRWLIAVLTPRSRAADITITSAPSAGCTSLDANALTDAVTTEINSYRGVDTSHAKVYGSPTDPRLTITVRTEDSANIAAIRDRIESNALAHIRQALERPDLPIILNINIGDRQSSRAAPR
ncbi:alkaline shock response membrane anchor protein AmaP [Micromonospora sp. DSM 115977]|uniref:Alkaline shock response membrane anchor protein AmaP n=1 Tax=Micromonospora reichwaldensis TaxID=3075516 RepID=A0ABU2WYC7_9ACTN|nr:alkaline shock response membrane anchor protein AmaP [Micromonospora sp. DSM 115977]MDT0530950.1 alkaline shock response membrane anchor protein AmaP [Micromonospora sp. DSM 115977]